MLKIGRNIFLLVWNKNAQRVLDWHTSSLIALACYDGVKTVVTNLERRRPVCTLHPAIATNTEGLGGQNSRTLSTWLCTIFHLVNSLD